jgi:RNA polymerase sigma factor (sigma-70 family)
MNYTNATDQQLRTIIHHDKDIPSSLLEGVVLEMIQRNLFKNIISFASKREFDNLTYMLHYLKLDYEDLKQIAHMEIIHIVPNFKPGKMSFKSFAVMCIAMRFGKLIRAQGQAKRRANIGTSDVDDLTEGIQTTLFQSSLNVEQYVINKITIENSWGALSEVEQKAVLLEQCGYKQLEIAQLLGYKRQANASKILTRAYAKLRKAMVA